jgi:hypothetical protein
MKSLKFIAIVVVITIATIVASYYTGYNRGYNQGYSKVITDVTCDTIVKVDTIVREKPVVRTQHIVDTMLVAVRDTIHHLDTAYIALPRTEKVYTDSTYKAKVSGYEPSLDYIEVYPYTLTIFKTKTIHKEAPHWSVGASAGPGALIDLHGKVHFGIGATIGLSYRF